MKKNIIFWGFLVLVFSIVTNCTGKKVVLEEKISKEKVKIVKVNNKDVYLLAIPIGFHLEFDRKKTISGRFYIIYDSEYVSGVSSMNLPIFDKNTGKKFFGIDKRNKDIFPEDGYIINRKILINK